MKVCNVQNNVSYNTAFSARVHLGGLKGTIPRDIYRNTKAEARKIGSRNDYILFYFGNPCVERFESQFESTKPVIQKYRQIFVTSTINGKTEKENLSYCVFNKNADDKDLLQEILGSYMERLQAKARKAYYPKYNY